MLTLPDEDHIQNQVKDQQTPAEHQLSRPSVAIFSDTQIPPIADDGEIDQRTINSSEIASRRVPDHGVNLELQEETLVQTLPRTDGQIASRAQDLCTKMSHIYY